MAVSVSVESPLQDEVRQLIGELNQALLALTPAEFCYHMTAEEMARSDTTVFVAREDGAAVACGALRRHGDGIGEVKRMYTRPAYQGRGIGGHILEAIEISGPQQRDFPPRARNRRPSSCGLAGVRAWRV